MNRTSWMQVLVVAVFVVALGAMTASPVMAGCKICGPGGCWDAGKDVSGKTLCVQNGSYCHIHGNACVGGSGNYTDPENIVQGGCGRVESGGVCEPFNERMITPEETMQLARILPETGWLQNHGQVAEVAAVCTGVSYQTVNELVR